MPAKRRTRARESQIAFEALAIEGGLLSPEWLSKIGQLGAGAQSEADYRIPKGLNLRDEIGRYWRMAQAHWPDFNSGRTTTSDRKSLSERFVTALLRESFGFGSLAQVLPAVLSDRIYPIGWAAIGTRVPVVIAPVDTGLDALLPEFGDGGRRRSAFGLTQEYLNAKENALWGITTDGATLRILRDNASLTRPAWIEADLARIFSEERYADFAVLWLLLHETRFGHEGQPSTDCALEAWRNAGREEGTRAREHLRRGVEEALVALGDGFLVYPDNQALRSSLQDGTVSKKDYFNQLLRLVYRLIFLLTVEERGLLHPDGTNDRARALYAQGYSMRRLRERSVKRNAHDRFSDLWEMVKIVFRGVAAGEPRLGLPALAGIFAESQCSAVDAAKLENRSLLLAVFKLAWLREAGSLARVNWRDMGPEELGSVYESLLELVPQITQDAHRFSFAAGNEMKGNARKTTGSYYTPDSLVQVLLDSALEPVIAGTIAKNPDKPADALLSLSIVDPACGSGHFLLAAARRLAAHVARLQAKGTPSAAEYRHALRQVVGHCIYGVDLNPMAVELCKVSLWMEAVEPGLPLTFLNSHIQHGNALLGATSDLMTNGIPDAAWEPIEGDDKKTAVALKKRNKAEASGQRRLDFTERSVTDAETHAVVRAIAELDAASDANPDALTKKESQWDGILCSNEYNHLKLIADAWCAAFFWPKQPNELTQEAPTNEQWRHLRDGKLQSLRVAVNAIETIARHQTLLHWELAFPQVFLAGGFDVVLGNPPWESLSFSEEEFFAARLPEIAMAPTASQRKKLIETLGNDNPELMRLFLQERRQIEAINVFVRSSGRYPLCGVGRVNLFALFAEAMVDMVSANGRIGAILPSGIVTDDSTKAFFASLVDSGRLVSLFDFENREGLFDGVHRNFKFSLLTAEGTGRVGRSSHFVFYAGNTAELQLPEKAVFLSSDDIHLLNPLSKTSPTFRSNRDAQITLAIHRRFPILTQGDWKLVLRRLINQSDDSENFTRNRGDDALPLYEGKYFHLYDHRWSTYSDSSDRPVTDTEKADPFFFISPRYWFPSELVRERFGRLWKRPWVLAWRDITNASNERTFIVSVLPSLAVPHTAKVLLTDDTQCHLVPVLQANLSSIALDFVARQKIGWTHMSTFTVEQLPVVPPRQFEDVCSWDKSVDLRRWISDRTLELVFTSWDLASFAEDMGLFCPPFRWHPDRRFLLRCELDAAFFHLYGLSREDTAYVMDTFTIVRKNDEKLHGGYVTKNAILEIYDAMVDAGRTGVPYQSRLDPPPADQSMMHESRTPEIPAVPDLIPSMLPEDAAGVLVLGLLRANGGTISLRDLARSFSLLYHTSLLVTLAPLSISDKAHIWASKISPRAPMAGLLSAKLRDLVMRSGIRQTTDPSLRSLIRVTPNTPAESDIDPWFRFEARLALHVLRSQKESDLRAIDDSVTGDDRALLVEVS